MSADRARPALRWRSARLAALITVVAGWAVVTGACGSATTGSAVSGTAARHLEQDVLDVMNHNGLPVMDSYITCRVVPDGHTQTCYGQSNDAPVQGIEGDFDASARGPASCPGSLTVKLDSALVERVRVDPCR